MEGNKQLTLRGHLETIPTMRYSTKQLRRGIASYWHWWSDFSRCYRILHGRRPTQRTRSEVLAFHLYQGARLEGQLEKQREMHAKKK